MRIAVTGSHGLIGRALVPSLADEGHDVVPVVRGTPGSGEIGWDPGAGRLDPGDLEGVDAVVHLAGEPIASRRWTAAQKRRIRESRTRSTALLARTIARMRGGPRTLVCASGVHVYGDRGDEVLTCDSGPGGGFLSRVVRAWEASADPARDAGTRVVHLRTGVVLAPEADVLARQLPLFRLGLGAKMGSGRQYMSWIAIDDVVAAYRHVLAADHLSGALNAVGPEPVTNAEFTRTLARVLGRPVLLPFIPRFGPRLVVGELADELLFYSQRVLPERLLADGFTFRFPQLEPALRQVLGRPAAQRPA